MLSGTHLFAIAKRCVESKHPYQHHDRRTFDWQLAQSQIRTSTASL